MNGEIAGNDGPTEDRPIGRWVTVNRGGSYIHVFIGPRGTVTRGPEPLLGVPYAQVVGLTGDGHATIHPKSERPLGFDTHPQYRQMRLADLPHRTPEDAARGLEQALANAPIPPWVRQMRHGLIARARTSLQRGEAELTIAVAGMVDALTIASARRQVAALPARYCALWGASGYRCRIVGRNATGLPDVAERERRQGTPGIFVPNRDTAYIFAQHTLTDYDLCTTLLEEIGHGLDLLIGVLHGHEGPHPGRIPLETVARSNQPDFLTLWTRNTHNAGIERYYRRNARELFAWSFTDYYYGSGILEREHPRLARFLVDLEREVAVHVGA
jgi:hypothetical protein